MTQLPLAGPGGRKKGKPLRERIQPYAFIAPAMIWICCIFLYSVCYNLFSGFFRVSLDGRWDFVGLGNYARLVASKEFLEITRNTCVWIGAITVCLQLIALWNAILLNQKVFGRGIYRTILLLPWVIPGVVTGILWKYMMDAKFGVINDVLLRLGLIDRYQPWLAQSKTAMIAVILAYLWKVTPFMMLLILGRLQGIPEDIYEAAEMEGAGVLKKFWFVTLPMLKDTLITTTIITMITAFNSYDLTYVMTGGGPVHSSEILGKYVYNLGFIKFDFGGASATGTMMFMASLLLIAVYAGRQGRGAE